MIKTFFLYPNLDLNQIKYKTGQYLNFDEKTIIINSNSDCYTHDNKLLFKFRKNIIPTEYCIMALQNLKKHAKRKTDNRGSASGLLDINKLPKSILRLGNTSNFTTKGHYNKNNKLSKTSISNYSQSNIVGYYDKPNRNLGKAAPKCRLTSFTKKNFNSPKWDECVLLFQLADCCFKELCPEKHRLQYDRANTTEFVIPNTSFSTVTVNYNWRTALHKDDGDFKEGFGNLMVLEEGKYYGGYLFFPRYNIAIDVRMGDFLAMDVHEYHCNTPIQPITEDYTRLSVVCYLREKMSQCKNT